MAAEIICDGCGKRVPMDTAYDGRHIKPRNWYERTDFNGMESPKKAVRTWSACSRECIEKIRKETGDATPIAPF